MTTTVDLTKSASCLRAHVGALLSPTPVEVSLLDAASPPECVTLPPLAVRLTPMAVGADGGIRWAITHVDAGLDGDPPRRARLAAFLGRIYNQLDASRYRLLGVAGTKRSGSAELWRADVEELPGANERPVWRLHTGLVAVAGWTTLTLADGDVELPPPDVGSIDPGPLLIATSDDFLSVEVQEGAALAFPTQRPVASVAADAYALVSPSPPLPAIAVDSAHDLDAASVLNISVTGRRAREVLRAPTEELTLEVKLPARELEAAAVWLDAHADAPALLLTTPRQRVLMVSIRRWSSSVGPGGGALRLEMLSAPLSRIDDFLEVEP